MITWSIQTVFAIDVCTVLLCCLVALRCASSPLHPSLMMLGCHGYIVTLRLSQLLRGQRPMSYTFVWPVGVGELLRAALASDAALVAMSAAWLLVRFWGTRRASKPREPRTLLSVSRVRNTAVIAMLGNIAAVAILGPHTLMAADPVQMNGYLAAASGWAPWSCCLLLYIYGFSLPLVSFTVVTLVVSILLSHFRGVVIIPLIFLIFTWLARRKTNRPPLSLIPAFVFLWLLWLPMKPIIYSLQAGKSVTEAFSQGIDDAFGHFGEERGSGIDFQFLDMIGSTMTLVDIHGSHYWGTTLAPLFVSPVPRSLWPGKPQLNQYQQELDIPARNMAHLNMTAGLLGQAYADYGYFGTIAVPFVISLCFSLAYRRLAGTTLLSPGALLYLIYLSTFMQLYRDGLLSAIWFPFVHCAPMGWLAVSHWIWPPKLVRRPQAQVEPLPAGLDYLPS